MSITIRYFANLKETLGRSGDEIEALSPLSARQVWQGLHPNRALPDSVLVAINMNYADLDSVVQDGDEVAFFPPVTGG